MTWQRAGLGAAIVFGLTLVETVPHAATMAIACMAIYVISRNLAGKAVLADGTPIRWETGRPRGRDPRRARADGNIASRRHVGTRPRPHLGNLQASRFLGLTALPGPGFVDVSPAARPPAAAGTG